MAKFMDENGVAHLWDRAKGSFVSKEEGKGLSTNDFTDEMMQAVQASKEMTAITETEINEICQ